MEGANASVLPIHLNTQPWKQRLVRVSLCAGPVGAEPSGFYVNFYFGLVLSCSERERPKLVASRKYLFELFHPPGIFSETIPFCLPQNSRERLSKQRVKFGQNSRS